MVSFYNNFSQGQLDRGLIFQPNLSGKRDCSIKKTMGKFASHVMALYLPVCNKLIAEAAPTYALNFTLNYTIPSKTIDPI
jgi:hypothetical protein